MKFHWMYRGDDISVEGLKNISDIVDCAGYESMLMVYHSNIPDFWIKSAHVLNPNHKFKYMPAIRTYAITPEYFYMMYRSFEDIAPGRVMFNILSGDIHQDEDCINNLIYINDKMKTSEDRLLYTDQWIKTFLHISKNKDRPKIVMSGHSDKTKQMAKENGFTHLSMLDMYLKNNSVYNDKQMIALCLYVGDSNDDVESFLSKLNDGQLKWTIAGTKQEIKEKIKEFNNMGISDIMISSHQDDMGSYRIHDLIKEIIEEQNGIN